MGHILRMGKSSEAAVDALEVAGGSMALEELAQELGISRVRNMLRAGGWLSRLVDAGVVSIDGDRASLTESWLDAYNARREEDEEVADYQRDLKKYQRQSAAYRRHLKAREEERRQERLNREAAACFGGGVDPTTGEIVSARRKVAPIEAARLAGEVLEASAGAPEPALEASEDGEAQERLRAQHEGPETVDEAQAEPLSELATVLRDFLSRCPHRRSERPSWLANYVWSEELVEGKPSEYHVAAALGELQSYERRDAAA